MNINLDLHAIKEYKHGTALDYLYSFSVKWFNPRAINFDLPVHDDEVNRIAGKIRNGYRLDPIIILKSYGVVAGANQIVAFRNLRYDRVPVLYGEFRNR